MASVDQVWADRAQELVEAGEAVIVDVREPHEWDQGHIPDAIHIPMDQVRDRLDEIPDADTVIFQCRSGGRSDRVAKRVRSDLDAEVANLSGGILAWERAGLPVETG